MGERQREVESALHAARVAPDLAVGGEAEAHALEELGYSHRTLRARHAVEGELELQVLAARQERVERSLLERGADRAAHVGPCFTTSKPPTLALPAVGGSSVVNT